MDLLILLIIILFLLFIRSLLKGSVENRLGFKLDFLPFFDRTEIEEATGIGCLTSIIWILIIYWFVMLIDKIF